MKILGIETSCDETAAAIVEGKKVGTQNFVSVQSNVVSSQIEIHKKYGGVVPEVAAREHVLNILPVVNEALEKADLTPRPPLLGRRGGAKGRGIDVIAVTVGPGLITSLMVGVETAKILSYVWNIPLVGVNHIEGHIYANFVSVNSKFQIPNSKQIQNSKSQISNIKFPALILTVSGGHTMLVLMAGHGKYKIIGETRDDAAGEAFDKAAKLLGVGYPGGPAIAAYAAKSKVKSQKSKVSLPRPMINSNDYDFSFSGLKTALLYKLKKDKIWKKKIPEYCAEFQQAVIDVLIAKTVKAVRDFKVKTIMLSGGVAANQELRRQMKEKIEVLIPDLKYTTDNAAMIATAGYFHALKKDFIPWQKIKVDPNLELSARG
ncbi:MAG: tRNA (adenosine(37)-N6)-threonylcarbamoyltransferase complex transferase subunit TsaD [Patescibacteria group bacterium]|nr:tRNA (adenosine(37)-N6)-threonylcarbamoyltransferase complex transferase subunit TsaD [Patescibacteria group bacterium]MDD5294913.1 tRNA (adenosine(37)-N6)-threonylcarbamoyltransferase complex transferase subunit TsaD [Patescibacteria group bacterium]MDD5554086.1 tRNA (adenosine(37)-N6)-threonylcarbamoyltransferase complex transferase subunit TsaD [Patescibacteria group bacterium]